jgi:hypothetical protein
MLDSLTKLIGGSKVIAVNIAGLLMAIAFIAFLLTVINYIWKRNSGNADGLKQAGNMLLASVFALFVMVAVWGLTNFIARNLGIGVGGCTSRPSPIPGEPALTDCNNTGSGNNNPVNTNDNKTSCPNGTILVAGYCEAVSDSRPQPTPPTNTREFSCQNGQRRQAANGETLSCVRGVAGEPCEVGTCASGFACSATNEDGNSYGTCQSI